jgi:hypothetical protein
LKLNGTRQLLFYADVNILGLSVHTLKKNTGALVVAGKGIGLEGNADKTIMSDHVSRSECRTKSQHED